MAKIDVTMIDGFDKMSEQDKINALLAFDVEPDTTGYVKKTLFDKTASEVAKWKKKHDELLSEDELKKAALDEERETLKNKVRELERENSIKSFTAKYVALGFDEKSAGKLAEALLDGDYTALFAGLEKGKETITNKLKTELYNETLIPGGGTGKKLSVEEIMKITDPVERQTAIAENIELFNG